MPDPLTPPTPSSDPDGLPPDLGRPTGRTRAVQTVGALVGLGLFSWAVSIALAPKNRPTLQAFLHADTRLLAQVLAISILCVIVDGLYFHVAVRPIKPLRARDVVGVNAIATFLGILPFKLGFVTRALIHRRRDGLEWTDLIAWFAACSAVALAVLVPVALAGVWRGQMDALWYALSIGGPIVAGALAVACGKLASKFKPLAVVSLGSWRVVQHPPVVAGMVLTRLAFLALAGIRFGLCARIAQVSLEPAQAVVLSTAYYFASVVSPGGVAGFAEMGTNGMARAMGGLQPDQITIVALAVTIIQTGTGLIMGAIASIWLRPDRLLRPAETPA